MVPCILQNSTSLQIANLFPHPATILQTNVAKASDGSLVYPKNPRIFDLFCSRCTGPGLSCRYALQLRSMFATWKSLDVFNEGTDWRDTCSFFPGEERHISGDDNPHPASSGLFCLEQLSCDPFPRVLLTHVRSCTYQWFKGLKNDEIRWRVKDWPGRGILYTWRANTGVAMHALKE